MINKFVKIENNRVIVNDVDMGAVVGSEPENPSIYDCYSDQVERVTIEEFTMIATPTGIFDTRYFIYNGSGKAQITGNGEYVTFTE